ncbi:enoyl-CoA hydratase/isomerase family protein [Rhodococcoides yunnanense]|uniref:enoyl-CoA hydratase/isomerase family protein n=1 Tax=Rhodococcoides yunnanense TaxID=278209 RepID=UPI0022B0B631|nr:enoyl-CoA hydratase-related protein [Rhodococcus yunnanensis]MCZ4278495.1 enoyl-CoA hydratase-related protein [Rhodococcus yunnanensis]
MTEQWQRTELETCFYERAAEGVVVLTLNRPDKGNSVVPEMARDLMSVIDTLESDRSVRAVVLTGAGRQFSAGADMVEMRNYLRDRLAIEQEPYNARVLFPVTQRLTNSRLVFVAAINGGATAGGLDFALACDIRVASDRAKLGETYINMGLAPGNGGTWFLPRLVGSGMAAELALTGEVVKADRALEIGLVGRVVPHDELIGAAVEIATKVASKPWRALEATKQALRASWQLDLAAAMSASFWTVSALYHTDDLHEAVNAYVDKRPPQFNKDVSPPSA